MTWQTKHWFLPAFLRALGCPIIGHPLPIWKMPGAEPAAEEHMRMPPETKLAGAQPGKPRGPLKGSHQLDGFSWGHSNSHSLHLSHQQDTQTHEIDFFPGSIAKGSSSKSGCQLHLPTSHANLSRVTSPANFSCQLVESYFTCQLLMPTCRELLHLPTSHANLSRVTSPAYFSCQLFESYFTCQLLMSTFRLLSHSTKSTS